MAQYILNMLDNIELFNLEYADPEHTVIQCMAKLPGRTKFVFFVADKNGPEPYGKTIHAKAISGACGLIKPFPKQYIDIVEFK